MGDDPEERNLRRLEKKKQKQFMSKFFIDVDPINELGEDIDQADLERISEDELTENREEILKERNKKKSQQNAENIQQQMI
mmetsp:Transcript_27101/g.41257  ORF Transcript_27101/g.41257 Transcript_27101/m.41257 type:complete len:81 (+) Transcript_27101:193-435(+)